MKRKKAARASCSIPFHHTGSVDGTSEPGRGSLLCRCAARKRERRGRRVISLPCEHFQLATLSFCPELDPSIATVGTQSCRLIRQQIPRSDHLLYFPKTSLKSPSRAGDKVGTSGKVGKGLQRAVPQQRSRSLVEQFPSADAIDHGLAPQRARNGF